MLSRELNLLKESVLPEDQRMQPILASILIHSERLSLILGDLHDAISAAVFHEFQTALENTPFPTQRDQMMSWPPPPPTRSSSLPEDADIPPPLEAFVTVPSSDTPLPPPPIPHAPHAPPSSEQQLQHSSDISNFSTTHTSEEEEEGEEEEEEEDDDDDWPDPEEEEEEGEEEEVEDYDDDGPPPLQDHELSLLEIFAWREEPVVLQPITVLLPALDVAALTQIEEEGEGNGGEENCGEGNGGGNGDVVVPPLNVEDVAEGGEGQEEGERREDEERQEVRHDCSICHDTFEVGQDIRKLRCNHIFHSRCVDRWLTEQRSTCPLCRMDQRTTYMV